MNASLIAYKRLERTRHQRVSSKLRLASRSDAAFDGIAHMISNKESHESRT